MGYEIDYVRVTPNHPEQGNKANFKVKFGINDELPAEVCAAGLVGNELEELVSRSGPSGPTADALVPAIPASSPSDGREPLLRAAQARTAASKGYDVEKIRKDHPAAYAPWTEGEEARLLELSRAGVRRGEELGRQPGGIRSRLRMLNTTEES